MYRHSLADLITYYMLSRDWRERIPVRTGVGARQSPARRMWIAITASIVPTLPFSLFAAAIVFAILNTRLSLWVTLCGSLAAGAIVVAIMNMFLDRFIFHKVIWLRRVRCRTFRSGELTPAQSELLLKRCQPYLDHLAKKPEQSLPGRGAPPRPNILLWRAMLTFSASPWRVMLPESVLHTLLLMFTSACASAISQHFFGIGGSGIFWRSLLNGLIVGLALTPYAILKTRASKRFLGLTQQQCPNCGHDLINLGGEAGPRRCPECGSH